MEILFWLVGVFCYLEGGALRLSVVLGGVVVFGCRVVSVKLVDFDVMVLELDSYCFYLELGGVMK